MIDVVSIFTSILTFVLALLIYRNQKRYNSALSLKLDLILKSQSIIKSNGAKK